MWRRAAGDRLQRLARQFPAVLVLGARQVGKTTLARRAFSRLSYCDLEDPGLRDLFTEDPLFQLESRARPGLVLDEAQAVPAVFAALRGLIDKDRRSNGRFIILGSAQPALVQGVSESLAGRVGVLDLDPLTAAEAATGREHRSWQNVWLRGGFPDALRGTFREWWESYLRSYAERDLPQLGVRADPIFVRRLLTMIAHMQGGLLNASALGSALGITYHTVQRHLDILEQTFLLRRLPPYFRNVGKRLVKSPKIFLRDSGLLHHLLNISTLEDLGSHPILGASWETFVLEDVIRREKLVNPHTQFFFWRTAAGAEIDLVLDRGSERIAIEVKAARGDKAQVARHLQAAAADIGPARSWIIDRAEGTSRVAQHVERRGFAVDLDWLPPDGRRRPHGGAGPR